MHSCQGGTRRQALATPRVRPVCRRRGGHASPRCRQRGLTTRKPAYSLHGGRAARRAVPAACVTMPAPRLAAPVAFVAMATLFVEQLTVIDCSVLDPQDGLIGESYIVDVVLDGALDEQGMVLDFSAVKKRLKQRIDSLCDHRLLVPALHAGLHWQEQDGRVDLQFTDDRHQLWQHRSPAIAVCAVPALRITAQTLADFLVPHLKAVLPASVRELQLTLREEAIAGAHYRYSHGLQLHDGACQRIAHGHRSRLQVFIDGVRREDVEGQWAQRWCDIYLASREHFLAERRVNEQAQIDLRYKAREGLFELSLPKVRVDWIDTATTVEFLAAHLATRIADEHGGDVVVRAFEGVQKGAIARALGRSGSACG